MQVHPGGHAHAGVSSTGRGFGAQHPSSPTQSVQSREVRRRESTDERRMAALSHTSQAIRHRQRAMALRLSRAALDVITLWL